MNATDTFLYHFAIVEIFVGAGACALFVLSYGLLAPWYRHEAGRHILAFTFALFLALALTAANVMGWTHSLGVTWNLVIQVAVLALVILVVLWRIWMFIRAQILHRTPR